MAGIIKVGSPLRKSSPSPSSSPQNNSHSNSKPNSPHPHKDKKKQEEEDRLGLLENRSDQFTASFDTSVSAAPDSSLSLKIASAMDDANNNNNGPYPLPLYHQQQQQQQQQQQPQQHGIWRDSSYDFQHDVVAGPRKKHNTASTTNSDSNGNSNSKGKSSVSDDEEDDEEEDSREFDFQKHRERESLEPDLENQCLSPVSESPNNEYGKITPRATKVSFKESELVHRRTSDGNDVVPPRNSNFNNEQVLRCSSSMNRKSASGLLMRMKTKSRLMDPPEGGASPTPRAGAAGMEKRSGRVGVGRSEEFEEDDPFDDNDLPDEYTKVKFSCFSIIQWVTLVLITAALVCSLVIPYLKGKTVWGMQLWKWGVMVLVLICGGLVSGWLIRIVVFLIERNFLLRKRVLYFVYGLRSAVQKFLWLGWVLLAWILILDKKVEKETNSKVLPYVTKILVCLMFGTLLWLIKTLLLKVLAMNFHVSAFFDRIQDALFNQYVIETLSGPPYLEIQRIQEEEDRVMCEVQKMQNAGVHVPADIRANCLPNQGRPVGSGRSIGSGMPRSPFVGKSPKGSFFGKSPRFSRAPSKREEEKEEAGISIDHLHRLNQRNISAWNMKRLMNIVRKGVLSTLDEQLLDSGMEDESALQIRSEKEAKAAAKRIFENVARPTAKHLYLDDIMRYLREEEAERAIRLFEGSVDRSNDKPGDRRGISKRALKNWVVNVFRERRALALSLNDTKTAVNKLHQLVNILVGIAIIIVWLLILGIPVTHFLVFVSSQVVVLAFMFGNTCKMTFESIIFLFVMHPFDVGDRCEIEGVQMIVEEMNILTTVFLRYDNQKIIYPNTVLLTKPIANYYRSPDMGDALDFCVHVSTPIDKIATMKERITRYIENKKDHWYAPMIVMRDVEDMNRIKFSLWLSHTMNHQDMGERWARRALLVEEMVKTFKELDIEYRMLPMDVNVRTLPPVVSDRLPSNWTACRR